MCEFIKAYGTEWQSTKTFGEAHWFHWLTLASAFGYTLIALSIYLNKEL